MPHSLVIVDDHILIAKALSAVVEQFPGYSVLYEVENGKVLMERFKAPKNIPDIVLLDISMPVMDGFETAKWLRQEHPGVMVLALSMQDDDRSLIRMIRNGAKGYLLKNARLEELKYALDQLVARGSYYSDWVTGKVFTNLVDDHMSKLETGQFTEKEEEFLKHCCTEMSYREIAAKMFVSPRTVEGYRDSCFQKLGLKTRVGLVLWAIKSGRCLL
jgi:DNA-binding NarL/FixJ family response regulator